MFNCLAILYMNYNLVFYFLIFFLIFQFYVSIFNFIFITFFDLVN